MNEIERKKFEAVLNNIPVKGYVATPDTKVLTITNLLKSVVDRYDTKLIIEYVKPDKSGTNILCLLGGNNGDSDWPTYLKQLSEVMSTLPGSWLIRLDNDPIDDVFNCYIGLPDKLFE